MRVGSVTRDGSGVTVVLLPEGTVGSVEARGGAPASRELALLEPTKLVTHVDALVLSGGSAFGLAAADGVARRLAEAGRGFRTRAGPVPIVPAACVFDLVASGGTRPGPADGEAALAAAARGEPVGCGPVGAGTGATVGKWRGPEHAVPGGLGTASVTVDDLAVGALAVVNAVGDVVDENGRQLAGSTAPPGAPPFPEPPLGPGENTTLVVVATDARLDPVGCRLLAESASDGTTRALRPAFTRFDGDIAFGLATGTRDAHLDRLRVAASEVVASAIRAAVRKTPG